MDAIEYAIGFLIFFIGLMISIGLHELGHMIPAKRFGAKVTQYFIGFGRTVWSRRRGETEYGVKAIPLGGYVKIVGMLPPEAARPVEDVEDEDGNRALRVRQSNTGMFTQLISDARAAEWELVRPGDEDRLFYKMAWWKKVVVMAGGPSVNVLIAFFCFLGLFAFYGNPSDPVIETRIAEVQACVVPAEESDRVCTEKEVAESPTPARQAGLERGDRIIAFNGTEITAWTQLQELIRANDDGAAEIVVERDGDPITLRTNTTVTPRFIDPDSEEAQDVGFLGVTPEYHLTTGGALYTIDQMSTMTVDVVAAIGTLPAKVWEVAKAIAGLQERDRQGPMSIVGGGRLAGEVAAHDESGLTDKVAFFILLLAGFNLFIGLFNFVPLLPLDGGHIASALWEALRRGIARLRGRPDPGYVDAAKLLPAAYIAAGFILIMGVVLIVGDLVVPISLYG